MKVIYIAGPFRAATAWDIELNVRLAEEIGFEVASRGCVPLIPHTLYRYFNGTITDQFWLDATLELLRRSDAALFVGNYRHSKGSMGEFEECKRLGIPAFDLFGDFEAWIDGEL